MTASGQSKLGRPPDSDGASSRARILDAARSCFVVRGYDQTTMKDIATESGMTAGALYHHFTSKQQLFVEVFHQHQESVFEELGKPVAGAGGSFLDRLSLLLDKVADMHASDPGLAAFTAVATIELQRHPDLRQLVRRDANTIYRFLHELVDGAPDEIAEGDRQGAVDMLVAMFTGFSIFGAGTRRADAHRSAVESFKRALAGDLLR